MAHVLIVSAARRTVAAGCKIAGPLDTGTGFFVAAIVVKLSVAGDANAGVGSRKTGACKVIQEGHMREEEGI